jgi:15-hydroxyprostaglandin dehydrogenase (NAD)
MYINYINYKMKYSHIIIIILISIVLLLLLFNVINYTNNNISGDDTSNTYDIHDNMKNQTALITGGARGIGKAYAEILLKNNYKVVILDKLNAINTSNELKQKYGNNNVLGIHCDITDFNAYNKAFEAANNFSSDGIIDILVLNAGITAQLFHNTNEIIQTNLVSPIYSAELYIKKITNKLSQKSHKTRQIIVTGSLASFKPVDLALGPVYDASKSGLTQFVRSLKPLAKRFNFRINALCPMTMVNTGLIKPMFKTPADKIGAQMYLNTEGRGSMMEPEDVAQGLLKVINNSSYNGDLITVDTNNNHFARLEPLDECGAYDEYGKWNEDNSYITKKAVDIQLNKLLNNDNGNIWS